VGHAGKDLLALGRGEKLGLKDQKEMNDSTLTSRKEGGISSLGLNEIGNAVKEKGAQKKGLEEGWSV